MSAVRVAALYVHPVKSLAAVAVSQALVTACGLAGDRRFMVVDEAGTFLSQRKHPEMARVSAALRPGVLALAAEGRTLEVAVRDEGEAVEVTVWDDTVLAIDQGEGAAAFLGEALGRACRLVYMPERTERRADPRYARPEDRVWFADGFPFLLVTTASVEAIARDAGVVPDPRRFRPNLVVETAEPWEEDRWETLRRPGLVLRLIEPCARCGIVDVDPEAGLGAGGVLEALGRSRKRDGRLLFGWNLVHDGGGTLSVGDELEVG